MSSAFLTEKELDDVVFKAFGECETLGEWFDKKAEAEREAGLSALLAARDELDKQISILRSRG